MSGARGLEQDPRTGQWSIALPERTPARTGAILVRDPHDPRACASCRARAGVYDSADPAAWTTHPHCRCIWTTILPARRMADGSMRPLQALSTVAPGRSGATQTRAHQALMRFLHPVLRHALTSAQLTEVLMAYISAQRRTDTALDDFGWPEERKYPITSQARLDAAARLIGRAPANKQAAIKRRIIAIAKRKGFTLPAAWRTEAPDTADDDRRAASEPMTHAHAHEHVHRHRHVHIADDGDREEHTHPHSHEHAHTHDHAGGDEEDHDTHEEDTDHAHDLNEASHHHAHADPLRRTTEDRTARDDDDDDEENDDGDDDGDDDEGRDAEDAADEDEDEEEHVRRGAEQPASGETHVDTALGGRRRSPYFSRFMEGLRHAMGRKQILTAEEVGAVAREAHRHATRTGIARARRRMADYDLNGDDATNPLQRRSVGSEKSLPTIGVSGLVRMSDPLRSSSGDGFALFVPVAQRFAEGVWVPCLPTPGSYTHPRYGRIVLSAARIRRMAEHVNSRVYGQDIPVDAEHDLKASGALGHIQELRVNADGSADARVDWNPRGKTMLAEDRFRYVSPEFYEEWTAPDTGVSYKDILIGLALTRRPFFKEGSLRPLVATETGFMIPEETPASGSVRPQRTPAGRTTMNEDQSQRFAELEAELDDYKAKMQQFAESARTANERVYALEQERARKIFAEEAEDLHTVPTDAYVQCMELLDADQRAPVKSLITELARKVAASEPYVLMTHGIKGRGVSSVTDELAAKVAAKRVAKPALTEAKAYAEVLTEEPDLYRRSLEE